MTGFEPATFALARRRSSQLSYIRMARTWYEPRATSATVQYDMRLETTV